MLFSSLTNPLPVSRPVLLVSALAACLAAPAFAQTDNNENPIPIIVTASRIEQSQVEAIPHTTVITSAKIEKKKPSDILTLLRQESGFEFIQSGGRGTQTSVFMRGMESRHVLILLDGVPLRDASVIGTAVELQHILPEQVERIEIVRGNVSAIYGSGAIGGVIQIFTKKGNGKPSVSLSAEVGTDSTTRLSAGISGDIEGTRYALSATRYKTDGFSAMNPEKMENANPDDDGNRDISVSASLSKEWSRGHELGVRLYLFDAKNDFDSYGQSSWGYTPARKDQGTSKLRTISAFTKNQFTSNWHSTVTASQTEMRRHAHSEDVGVDDRYGYRSETSRLQWNNEIALAPDWILTVGADGEHEKVVTRTDDAYSSGQQRYQRNNYSAYAGLNGQIGSHHLQANVRYDDVDGSGSDTTGYLGYAFDLTPSWKLLASASTAFLAPTLYQLHGDGGSYVLPNPHLSAERSHSYEAGIQYASGATLVRMTYFDTRTRDLIDYDDVNFPGIYRNIGKTKNKGVELSGSSQIAGIDIRGSLTIQNPENRETGEELVRRARKYASLDVSKTFGSWYVGGDVYYARHRPDINNKELPSYVLFNMNVRYEINRETSVYARIENLFDRDYETAYGYNQPDRAVFAGINWKM